MTAKGGNYNTLRRKIKELNLDTSHFKGQAWSKGKNFIKRPTEDYLNNTKEISSWKLKNRLLKEHLKENVCEMCGISEWNGKPISCQLHHKDGNNANNSLDNLQMLCPNCHSQTDNFAGKNLRQEKPREKKTFAELSRINSHVNLGTRRIKRPSYEQFQKEFAELQGNYSAMGRKYGVTDNAIRKWVKSYERYGV